MKLRAKEVEEEENRRRKENKEEERKRKNTGKENLEMPQDKLTTFYYTHLEELLDS